MVSWWVPYLPKVCRPDFNNGLGGDSNGGSVLAAFWPRGVYLSPTRIMVLPGPLQSCIRGSMYLFGSPKNS